MGKIGDYNKFRLGYESSGLTQADYGKQVGLSASMVHYYLKKTKPMRPKAKLSGFAEVVVQAAPAQQVVRITTAAGTVIEVPL